MKNLKIDLILLMGGSSNRFKKELATDCINKNLYQINKKPLIMYTLTNFLKCQAIDDIYLVVKDEEINAVQDILDNNNLEQIKIVKGGTTRNQSVQNALKLITSDYVLIHDGARPAISLDDINNLIEKVCYKQKQCGSLYHQVTDTIKEVLNQEFEEIKTLNRSLLKAVSTPQVFIKDLYEIILNNQNLEITDELCLFEKEYPITLVEEIHPNPKITKPSDLEYLEWLLTKNGEYKIGHSFDYHNFSNQGPLILGGIKVSDEYGLDGWSDADVLYHAVTESILGALQLGDIGTLFPDQDLANYKRNSKEFVLIANDYLKQAGYEVKNIDLMIYLQKPNLKNYKKAIAQNLKKLLNIEYINVKATTLEKQGLVGSQKGIATEVVVLIQKKF